ncbi:MAG: hypothetical protein ABXS91_08640 [Sulfurimonas sp.]
MKLELDNEIMEALGSISDWGKFFDETEYKAWKELIKEHHANDETDFLYKVLGIAYVPCINLVTSDDTKHPAILEAIGLKGKDDDYICRIAYMLYKDDKFKVFGNPTVTEALNHISINGKDVAHSYFDMM